jgi:hypothetical protein
LGLISKVYSPIGPIFDQSCEPNEAAMMISFSGPVGPSGTEIYDSAPFEEESQRRTNRVGSEELLTLRPPILHYGMRLSAGYRLVMGWWKSVHRFSRAICVFVSISGETGPTEQSKKPKRKKLGGHVVLFVSRS